MTKRLLFDMPGVDELTSGRPGRTSPDNALENSRWRLAALMRFIAEGDHTPIRRRALGHVARGQAAVVWRREAFARQAGQQLPLPGFPVPERPGTPTGQLELYLPPRIY